MRQLNAEKMIILIGGRWRERFTASRLMVPSNGPVRIGIYGEWGTGKTSVLEFIASMAKKDEQIVIRFNPWQHSTKDSLWRAFVLAVFSELEVTFGKLPEADAETNSAPWALPSSAQTGGPRL